MKSDIRRIGMILLLVGLGLISGCFSVQPLELAGQITRESLVLVTDIGDLVFELLSSESLFIRDLTVNHDNQELVIKGRIKRGAKHCCDRVTGHIDVAVFSPDGYLINALSTWLSPRYIPKHGSKSSRFEARIFEEVPAGSSIRVAYHGTTELEKSALGGVKLDCGENVALLGSEKEKIETIRLAD